MRISFSLGLLLLCTGAFAQFSQEYTFNTPLHKHAPYNNSFGFMMMSPNIHDEPGEDKPRSSEVRLGIDFDITGCGKAKILNAPLISPLGKLADLKVNTSGIKTNLVMRFSLPYENALVPYVDVFAGWRHYSSNMIVTPHDSGIFVPSSTFYKANRFNFGAATGLILSLGSAIKINAGINVSCLGAPVNLPDLQNAYFQGNSVVFNKRPAQNYTAMFKVGIVLVFNDELNEALSFLNGCSFGGGGGGCGSGSSDNDRSSSKSSGSNSGSSSGGTKGKVDVIVK